MEPAYLSAFAALAGSAIGGLTTLTASWLTQRVQVGAQQLAHDVSRREELYKAFIELASKSYAHALQNTEVDVARIVRLYALVSRMRMMASQPVVDQANAVMQMIMDTYHAPNRSISEEDASLRVGGLDPLLNFSHACRDEFRQRTAVGPRLR